MSQQKRKKVGLALGSGGARGLSHIGVIKALRENDIPIDFIAGSSMGAVIGGFYAATEDIKEAEKVVLETDWQLVLSLIDPSLRQGLIGGERIKSFIEDHIGKIEFKNLPIPFSAVATDMDTGEAVSLNEGEVSSAIRASISLPLVFKPAKHDSRLLTDGGLSRPVPVETVREMGADIIIAVNLDADYFSKEEKKFGFYKIANRSINLLRFHLSRCNVKKADVVVTPRVGDIKWNDFLKGKKAITVGEEASQSVMPQLKEKL